MTALTTLEPALGWNGRPAPRLPPLRERQLPWWLRTAVRLISRRARVPATHVFLTLGRHRRLFPWWALFASRLMPYGILDRRDCELAILRVAWNCRCRYEWVQHACIALDAGLQATDIARVADGPDAAGWDAHQAAILRTADEVHHARIISDDTWAQLSRRYDDKRLIELCMVIGHYEMLATLLGSLGVEVEAPVEQRLRATDFNPLPHPASRGGPTAR